MKIYNYDKTTKEFLYETEAKPDPKSKGNYLLPANSTSLKPPSSTPNYVRCYINNEWVQLIDNRDKEYYLDYKLVEFNIGDKVTQNMTLSKYSEIELLGNSKQNAKNELEMFYDSKEFRAFIINGYPILNTSSFRSLVSDQIEPLKDSVAKGLLTNETAIFQYRANGNIVNLTLDELISIRIKMVLSDINPLFAKKDDLVNQLDTLSTIEDVDNWLISSKLALQDLKDSL